MAEFNYNKAAHKSIKRAIAHKEFRQSYHAQKNVDPALVYRAFDTWAASKKLSRFTRHALRSQIDVRSASEFRAGISKGVDWLAQHLRHHPRYAMIVEIAPKTAKSSTWLAGPVIAELRAKGLPKPTILIPSWLPDKLVDTALSLGVTAFVHVDDAIYSGAQKASMLGALQAKLAHARVPRPVDVYIAAAYSTGLGTQRVLHEWEKFVDKGQRKLLRVHVFAPHEIKKRAMPLASRLEFAARGRLQNAFRGGPTMTVLSHKVPNTVSFGPGSLSDHLVKHIQKPVYKRIQLPIIQPPADFGFGGGYY